MATTVSSTTNTASTATTTTSSSASKTTSTTAAANRAAAQKLISSMSAGSGVDVASLAQNLVDAERIPQENAINAKITKNESKISGYGAVSYVLSQVQTALKDLKDQKSFNTLAVDNSQPNALGVTASSSATVGTHDVEILALAKAQRSVSNSFTSPTQPLNPSLDPTKGMAATYSLNIGPVGSAVSTEIKLSDSQATPQGLVDAINAANKGVTAQLISTGDTNNPYKISLVGEQGEQKQFTLTPQKFSMGGVGANNVSENDGNPIDLHIIVGGGATTNIRVTDDTPDGIVAAINASGTGLTAELVPNPAGSTYANKIYISGPAGSSNFSILSDYLDSNGAIAYQSSISPAAVSLSTNQAATNAQLKVDGVTVTRSSNTVSDVLSGVTLNLKSVTNGSVSLGLTRDNTALKTKMDTFVTAYNDAMTIFSAVSDPKSTLETYGATLVGDSTVRSLRQQLRDMVSQTSSTPGSSVGALWQVGFKIDEKGVMTLDSTKLDQALSSNFDDVVKTFTGNQNGLSASSATPGGIAGDAFRKLSTILGPTGVLLSQTNNADQQNQKYKEQLTKLQTRMDALLVRYQKQFATMDTLVGNVNSQKTSLKSSFEGMMAMYTNK